jgi:hypothetical protein
MTTSASPVRVALVADFTPEQLAQVTRGISLAAYVRAFSAGAGSWRDERDLDARLGSYLNRSPKSDAQEQAWLDGNTYGDEGAEGFIRARILGEI